MCLIDIRPSSSFTSPIGAESSAPKKPDDGVDLVGIGTRNGHFI